MKRILLSCALILLLSNCTTPTPAITNTNSGVLQDYSILKKVSVSNDTDNTVYRYLNPTFDRKNYYGVIIKPVILNDTVNGGLASSEQHTNTVLNKELHDMIHKQFHITRKPGHGIAILQVAITGVKLSGDGLNPKYIIPISRVQANAASDSTDKSTVVLVEAKISDSRSGELLGASAIVIQGKTLLEQANTPEAFQEQARSWIKSASKYAAGYYSKPGRHRN